MATLTDSQIRQLCKVAEWTKGMGPNQFGTKIASLRVLYRLGLIESRSVTDRRGDETRRIFATPAGIAELRRLATDAALDPRLALRVRNVLADANGLSHAQARVYATIAASPRPVAIEGRDALSIGALRSAGLVEILDVRPTHDHADKRHNGSTYTVRAVSK